MTELPEGWAECRLSEITQVNPPLDRCPYPETGPVHFVPMPAVEAETGQMDISATRPYHEVKKGYTAFVAGDVLFAKITPCMENGKMAVVPELPLSVACGSTEFHVLRPRSGIVAEYVYHFVSAKAFRYEAEHNMTGAVGQKRVPTGFVAEHTVPLPPTAEQHRIVAKIEALFSELDAGQDSLTRAQAQLRLYRQSLLKAAFQGRLTADWRAANPDKLESPETLLSRIRTERDARYKQALDDWQESLAEWRAGGEVGRKPGKPKRWTEISSNELIVDHRGWITTTLDKVIGEVQQGWSPKCDGNATIGPDDWAILKTTAVQHGRYSDIEIKLLPKNLKPRPEIEIISGDFLMTRKGPRVRTGVVCLVRQTRPNIMLCDTVYRFRCDEGMIYPPLLEVALNSPEVLREIDSLKSGISESGISLNHGKIRSVTLTFAGHPDEQKEMVKAVEQKLSSVDAIETEITTALAKITALRQSILKQAFSGRLVPQDPADEPASTLLARLRASAPPARAKRKTPA